MTLQDAQIALTDLAATAPDEATRERYEVELRAHNLVAAGLPCYPVGYRSDLLTIHMRAIQDALARREAGEITLGPIDVQQIAQKTLDRQDATCNHQ